MRRGRMHQGIDIAAPEGTEIRSAGPGVVVDVSLDGQRSRYGNVVIVEHPDGACTMYAHLAGFAPGIAPGVRVLPGTVVGYVGGTQLPEPPMTPHLHFEVHQEKVLMPSGRVIVNPQTPRRYEPQAWLQQHQVRLTG
jgi:murein DD-endopeptidase MepM/ murein hydrolase activator NlpD